MTVAECEVCTEGRVGTGGQFDRARKNCVGNEVEQ